MFRYARGSAAMERKVISISSKRQLTIPQKYFDALDFTKEEYRKYSD